MLGFVITVHLAPFRDIFQLRQKAIQMERVENGCLVHLVNGTGTTGNPPRITFVDQHAYDESASLTLYSSPDVLTTLAFRGGSPPNARIYNIIATPMEPVEWAPIPGTSWWRCDGLWMLGCVILEGGQNGTVLRIGYCLDNSLRRPMFDGMLPDIFAAHTHPLYDAHQAPRFVITLPGTSNDDHDVEVDLHDDALCDTVQWCTDSQPSACLRFGGHPRLYITPALSEAVACGIVGSYDNDTHTAQLWLGQVDMATLPSMSWSFGQFY
jgi:hypothetical protein